MKSKAQKYKRYSDTTILILHPTESIHVHYYKNTYHYLVTGPRLLKKQEFGGKNNLTSNLELRESVHFFIL